MKVILSLMLGASLALTRDCLERTGGLDEAFVRLWVRNDLRIEGYLAQRFAGVLEPSDDDIDNAFDSITYEKGSGVIPVRLPTNVCVASARAETADSEITTLCSSSRARFRRSTTSSFAD